MLRALAGAGLLSLAAAHAAAATLRCVSLDYPPLIQQKAGEPVRGAAVDVVRAVMQRLDYTVEVEILPWGRALQAMRNGERDCIFTIFASEERERFLDFSREVLVPQVIYFYARKGSAIDFGGDLRSVSHLRIGTVLYVNYGNVFEAARPYLAISEVPSLEQNFRKLSMDRVDLIASNFYTASYTLEKILPPDIARQAVRLPLPVETVPSYVAFAKPRHAALRDRFDRALRAYIASGEYQKQFEAYGIEWTPELAHRVAVP